MVTTKARTTARRTPLITQVWAFRIHCNILFPYRRHGLHYAVLCLYLFILENAKNFATLLAAGQAGHWRIFALSTTLFLVIVGGH
jgi:hypothetical protein